MIKSFDAQQTGAAYLVWAAIGLAIGAIGWLLIDDPWGRIAAVLLGVSLGLVSGFEIIARCSDSRRAAGISEEYDPEEDEWDGGIRLNPGNGMPMVSRYLDLGGNNRGLDD